MCADQKNKQNKLEALADLALKLRTRKQFRLWKSMCNDMKRIHRGSELLGKTVSRLFSSNWSHFLTRVAVNTKSISYYEAYNNVVLNIRGITRMQFTMTSIIRKRM
jgi:hypothetical protein